ncbi:MAG: hypothetical protein A2W25_10480 [candidate division Zixibacteria bacterium RBG_16_53_22]|nr:MAG: hypothetical protein A2W25_10480 [candidate division Zixibacteria bacterium RBG_16_53_22]
MRRLLPFLLSLFVLPICYASPGSELFRTNPNVKAKVASQALPRATQGMILQGGDNISDATVIGSIPYSDTGTTEGYADDYLGSCGYDGGSPDVVYSYSPVRDTEWVEISMCTDSANYDTRLYVFENDPDNEIACNDDGCPWSNQSYLDHIRMLAGNIYYIIVDGYDGGYGHYVINFNFTTPPPPVPPNDNCEDVTPDTLIDGEVITWLGDNSGATNDCNLTSPNAEVWHAFTVNERMDIAIDACGTIPSLSNAFIVIMPYCPCSGYVFADSYGWDECGDGNWTLHFYNLMPGTYYVPVFSDESIEPTHPYQLQIIGRTSLPPPTNDRCVDAMPIGDVTDLSFSNIYATPEYDPGEPNCMESNDIWYVYTAPYDCILKVDLCGSRFDSRLAVYDGYLCDPLPNMLVCSGEGLCGNPDWGRDPEVAFRAVGGQQYLFQVGGDFSWGEPRRIGEGNITVTATLPVIAVSPSEVLGQTSRGGMDSEVIQISNIGTGDLTFSLRCSQDSIRIARTQPIDISRLNVGIHQEKQSPIALDKLPAEPGAIPSENLIREMPARILQGGEDINTATPVTEIPFAAAGTTIGYANDYAGVCGIDAGAPDVVYSYTPVEPEEYITIDLCSYYTDFDTRLYVFENDPLTEIACDDDGCLFIRSRLSSVPMNFGNIYYIVVDGFGTGAGNYMINVSRGYPYPPNDNCDSVVPSNLLPGDTLTFTGNTANATSDCPQYSGFAEVWEAFTIDVPMNVTIDLCNTNPPQFLWNQLLVVGCPCQQAIDYSFFDADACADGNEALYFSALPPGTYYYPLASNWEEAGPYTLNITGEVYVPCELERPAGAIPENEPQCYDGYIDEFNGGCESFPPFFGRINEGDTIWGESGTFLLDGVETREADWYEFRLPWPAQVTVTSVAEFSQLLILIKLGDPIPCDYWVEGAAEALDCDTITLNQQVLPGIYAIYIAPNTFSRWECGLNYVLTLDLVTTWLSTDVTEGTIPERSSTDITVYMNAADLEEGNYSGLIDISSNDLSDPEVQVPVSLIVSDGCSYIPGDINFDGRANGIDVTFGVVYFKGGNLPPIDCVPPCVGIPDPFYAAGDVNADCRFNGIDITYFVAYLKQIQPALLYCQDCPPAGASGGIGADEITKVKPELRLLNRRDGLDSK